MLQYLYAEFDDGKDVLIKSPHDMWEEVLALVPIASRRWFPQSAATFGKELVRIKQALAYKGFEVGKGTVGRGNTKRSVIKVTPIDGVGQAGARTGQADFESPYPAQSGIDKPESARPEEVGQAGQGDSLPSSEIKKKKGRRNSKKRRRSPYPAYPTPQKSGESGLDKPEKAGQGDPETPYPTLTPNGDVPAPKDLITTDEGVQEAIRKLKGNK